MKRDAAGRFAVEAGQYLDDKGYWRYSAGPNRGKRVHRVLMAEHVGRQLRKDEVVHHRDGNKQNNREHADGKWNLDLMGEAQHNAVSSKQYWYLRKFVWPQEKQAWESYFGEAHDGVASGAALQC